MIKKEVYCTIQFEATHFWKECPFEEVKYLQYPHRHVFHIKAFQLVTHNNRDIEFIMLKHNIEEYLQRIYPDHRLGSMSCEMLAEELIEAFDLSKCEVSEDNENGAILTKESINEISTDAINYNYNYN
jgi:hypothetical protein